MAIKNSWSSGEVLTAADLTDTMKGVFINAQTSTSYTFGTADGFVTLSNASGGTATIPANATAAFNTGAVIGVMNAGTAGSFTIGTAAGVTLNASSATLSPLERGQLVKTATNTWYFTKGGSLDSPTFTGNVVWSSATLRASTAEVTTSQNTTSTSYTDLATSGPAVTVTTGTKALVIIGCDTYNSGLGDAWMSWAVSGASTVSAADKWGIHLQGSNNTIVLGMSRIYLATGLTAGSNTFTAKYRVADHTGYFSNRHITVIDMGS